MTMATNNRRPIIKYERPVRVSQDQFNPMTHRWEAVEAFTYDGPLRWTAPTAGPYKGRKFWRTLKKHDPLRVAWSDAGEPVGCFRVMGDGTLQKCREPK